MGQYNNSIFGISFQDCNLINVESKFNLERDMDDYDDTTFYISKEVYHHDQDPDFKFDYMYGIEAYTYEDENDHTVKTFYTLYMIPTFSSLSKNKQNDVIESSGTDEPNITDVFNYGISIVFASENIIGEYDKSIMDKIASIIDAIDSFRAFYLDKAQNRIGTDGWMMLDDYINDVDFTNATFEKFKSR
jgi:hypothetical protein